MGAFCVTLLNFFSLELVFSFSLSDAGFELGHPARSHVVMHEGHRFSVYALLELEFKVAKKRGQGQFTHHFDECLANADSTTT